MASLAEVGQILKEAREAQGRTQEDIANQTRIALRHIRALEEGNEAELPEVFYVRSFLKKYAEALGLSPTEMADAYRSAPLPTTTPPSAGVSVGPIVYYLLVVVLIGAVLALAWHFQPRVSVVTEPSPALSPSAQPTVAPTPSPVASPVGSPMPGSPSPSASPKGSAKPGSPSPSASPKGSPKPGSPLPASPKAPSAHPASASPAPAAVPASPKPSPAASPVASVKPSASPAASKTVKVEVLTQERAWMEVRQNGRIVYEGLSLPGRRRTYSGKTVQVTTGNGGGVRVTVNGQDLGLLGSPGAVVTKTFQP